MLGVGGIGIGVLDEVVKFWFSDGVMVGGRGHADVGGVGALY